MTGLADHRPLTEEEKCYGMFLTTVRCGLKLLSQWTLVQVRATLRGTKGG